MNTREPIWGIRAQERRGLPMPPKITHRDYGGATILSVDRTDEGDYKIRVANETGVHTLRVPGDFGLPTPQVGDTL